MDAFLRFLPLLKVGGVFGLMLVFIRLKVPLWLSILAGSLAMSLAFGKGPLDWARSALPAPLETGALLLTAIVGLIMGLSRLLETTGQARRLTDSLSGLVRGPRLRLVLFPALIGLLPMPGGAVFSAPMLQGAARRLDLSPLDKSLLNYWFRHVWEFCWPLFPGLILASSLTGIPISTVVLAACPGTLALLGLGWLFFLRPGRLDVRETAATGENAPSTASVGQVLAQGAPLITAICGAIGLEALMAAYAPETHFEYGILAALAGAIACIMIQNRLGPADLARSFLDRRLVEMLLVVAAIFCFKESMAASGVVDDLAAMAGADAALVAAAGLLPFLVGMVSGITLAFVGASFPLLLGLLDQLGLAHQTLPWALMALFSGFAGVMASPMHICFLLTCRWFGQDVAGAWRRLVLPCALFWTFGAAYVFLLLRLG